MPASNCMRLLLEHAAASICDITVHLGRFDGLIFLFLCPLCVLVQHDKFRVVVLTMQVTMVRLAEDLG